MVSLKDYFHENLCAEVAVNENQIEEAYRIRHSVYCKENNYEDPSCFPEQMEMDEYDRVSVQALIRHKATNYPIGVIRVIFTDPSNPDLQLPIEKQFGQSFDTSVLKEFHFSRSKIVEISRFAISKEAISKVTEMVFENQLSSRSSKTKSQESNTKPRLLLPHISLGLLGLALAICVQQGATHWYAAMEPSLSRLLTRFGMHFAKIGPLMDYHGRRQPMMADVDSLLADIKHERNDFFQLIESFSDQQLLSVETMESVQSNRA